MSKGRDVAVTAHNGNVEHSVCSRQGTHCWRPSQAGPQYSAASTVQYPTKAAYTTATQAELLDP